MNLSDQDLSRRPLVVVVEDNESTNHLLSEWLRLTYRVQAYHSAEEVPEIFPSGEIPAAVIMDYHLPGKSGIELKAELAARLPGCKYILMSGVFDETLRKVAQDQGFDELLSKPFNPKALSTKLQSLLGYPPSRDLTTYVKD